MKYLGSVFVLLFVLCACVFADYVPSKGEIRGIWINSDKMPKTETETVNLVREYSKAGFNLLFPEVICRGYAVYPSKILERDPRFTESIDMLSVMIKEAHSMNMEVHPWVWCFRAGYTDHPGAIIKAHPEWLDCSINGDTLSVNGGMWLSPSVPEVQNYLLDLYKEIVSNYDIDGFHLDYVRYESQIPCPYGYSDYSVKKYTDETGYKNPKYTEYLSRDYFNWNSFREKQINEFVKKTSEELKKIKPDIILSAAVAMDPKEARLNYMQNWAHWADNGWLDLIVPMTYVTDNNKFKQKLSDQLKKLDNKVWTAVGIGSLNFIDNEINNVRQIEIARKSKYLGQALFASQYMTPSLENLLSSGVWKEKVGLPFKLNTQKALKITSSKGEFIPAYNLEDDLGMDLNEIRPIPSYVCFEKHADIKIDGNCENTEWGLYTPAYINSNNMGIYVSYPTYVKMTYDDEAIYLCYICQEPKMSEIKAKTKKRDGNVFYDDSVEFFVQPDPEKIKYDQFSVNTDNIQFDQQIYNTAWNKKWESAIAKYAWGWTCEIKIPLKEIGVEKVRKLSYWRINFTRNRAVEKEIENLVWSVTYGSFHTPQRFGYVFFE